MHFHSHFIHFQSTVKQHDFLSLQRRFWVFSRIWTSFIYSDSEVFCLRNENKFQKNSSGSLELVVDSKTRLFEYSASASSNLPQPCCDYGEERRSAFKWRRRRYGHKRVSSVWSGRCWIMLGIGQLDVDAAFRRSIDAPFSPYF